MSQSILSMYSVTYVYVHYACGVLLQDFYFSAFLKSFTLYKTRFILVTFYERESARKAIVPTQLNKKYP